MKSKTFFGIYIPIISLVMLLPFILDALINNNILTFSLGAVDTWIDFWGSYVGALIGASVVYFVAKIQITQQSKQQIAVLEHRAEYEMKREMKFFYVTNLMSKIEEFIDVMDELSQVILGMYDSMLNISHALSAKEDSDEPQIMNVIRDNELKRSQYVRHSEILTRKIDQLVYYITNDEERVKIITLMKLLVYEYENIELHYDKYLIDYDTDTEIVGLSGIAEEAGHEISRISQDLRQTLTNIQYILSDVDTTD